MLNIYLECFFLLENDSGLLTTGRRLRNARTTRYPIPATPTILPITIPAIAPPDSFPFAGDGEGNGEGDGEGTTA